MKNVLPTTLILSSLTLLAFAFLLPTSSSNQLAAIASTPSITFKQSSLSVTEGDRLKVTIVAPSPVTATTRVKVTTKSGTAKTGTDFTPVNTTVTFYKGGLKEKTIALSTKSDSVQEEPETLTLSLAVGNKVVNTTIVTLNNKGTTGTPGSTLPATANQGNTLGGNPSFTTYSPQGLPQPMNPKCKQVPSKYTFEQIKFPPNNPSNPFYTWEDVYGAAFPLSVHEGGSYSTFAIKGRSYVSYQIQVPPVSSPIFRLNNPTFTRLIYYPAGSLSNNTYSFVSECPWQDYYDEVINPSPIRQEYYSALATQGVQILQQQTFLQSDLYKRYTAELRRIEKLKDASGACDKQNAGMEDVLLNISSRNDPARSDFCYVKPGGTYYITFLVPDNSVDEVTGNTTSPYRTYKIFHRPNNTQNLENFMNHPDIGKYGIAAATNDGGFQNYTPLLKPKKRCLLGDPLRTDCWMGKYGMGIEKETDGERQEASAFRWNKSSGSGAETGTAPKPACRPGTKEGSACNNTATDDIFCVDGSQVYACGQGQEYPSVRGSGFGPL